MLLQRQEGTSREDREQAPKRSALSATNCGYIPLGVWLSQRHPELKGGPRVVYMALGQFANAGNLRPSKRELRLATGLSENTVDSALKSLRDGGWLLADVTNDGRTNAYRLLRGPWLDAPAVEANTPPQAAGGGAPPPSLGVP